MATLPTPEETARKILAIYARNQCRPGHCLLANVFLAQARFVGLAASDIADGLQFAMDEGWVVEGPNSGFCLTEEGFAEMPDY